MNNKLIIIVVLGGLVLMGVGVYQYITSNSLHVPSIANDKIYQSSQNQNTQATHLKTYRNSQYGLEFQYPVDYVLNEESDLGYLKIWIFSPIHYKNQNPNTYIDAFIVVGKNNGDINQGNPNFGYYEFMKNNQADNPVEKIMLGGQQAYKTIQGKYNNTLIASERNGMLYTLELDALDENGNPIVDTTSYNLTDQQQRIVSTFKFTK